MNFLLDTNVVSELAKPEPSARVVRWLAEADEDRLFLSVITLAELSYGARRLASGRRRKFLEIWIQEELPDRFEGRILNVGHVVADKWGLVMARSEASGKRMSAMDGLFAATAETYGLVLVTRNTGDFARCTERMINPWSGS